MPSTIVVDAEQTGMPGRPRTRVSRRVVPGSARGVMKQLGTQLPFMVVLVSLGCQTKLDVPSGARITCSSKHECPKRLVCSPRGRCVDPDELDAGQKCDTDTDCADACPYCIGGSNRYRFHRQRQ